MGKKLRVYELARELNLDNSEVIWELQHMGVPVTSHSNTVEDRLADQLRRKVQAELAEAPQQGQQRQSRLQRKTKPSLKLRR
jgi:hypothetical protein